MGTLKLQKTYKFTRTDTIDGSLQQSPSAHGPLDEEIFGIQQLDKPLINSGSQEHMMSANPSNKFSQETLNQI